MEIELLTSHFSLLPSNFLLAPGLWRGRSDRLGERQESRFENLKVFEFDPMLLGGSAPKPPGFFEA